jgi:farnesyl diphosphate synthase
MSFAAQLVADAAATGKTLDVIFAAQPSTAPRLRDAMIYATMNGGKRLRGALVLGAARLAAGVDTDPDFDSSPDAHAVTGALRVAAALEMLHGYSLVHDDLPAMDDAAMRRGKPSCHIAFDQATAILAGDALQTLAFGVLADAQTHSDGNVQARLVARLAAASGLGGMAGGQMLDLQAETRQLTLEEITLMQSLKTGALIQCAAVCGGIVGGGDARLLAALDGFSRDLGLAFQIADDLLDYDGDATTLGKPTGQDADRGKGSFVSLMGLEPARAAAQQLVEAAVSALAPWPTAGYLSYLATFAIARNS